MKYLMGVDEGTTGCKAILFTDEGTQIASTAREYPSYYPNMHRNRLSSLFRFLIYED